jgi:hypothetical protein
LYKIETIQKFIFYRKEKRKRNRNRKQENEIESKRRKTNLMGRPVQDIAKKGERALLRNGRERRQIGFTSVLRLAKSFSWAKPVLTAQNGGGI